MANSKKNPQSEKRTKTPSAPKAETAQPAAKPSSGPAAQAGAQSSAAAHNHAAQPPPAAPAKTQPRSDAQGRAPTQEQIAKRAYQIFQARGAHHGRHAEDWKQAEQELKLGMQ